MDSVFGGVEPEILPRKKRTVNGFQSLEEVQQRALHHLSLVSDNPSQQLHQIAPLIATLEKVLTGKLGKC